MAVTENTYTGNGSTTNYSFTFPYLDTGDIKVTLNGTLTTAYTLANATTISFTSAPANGTAIRIYRDTDTNELKATYFAGSAVRAQDLNTDFLQSLYASQESENEAAAATVTSANALTAASNAVSTANTANTNASAAVSTANTAASNASAAVSTANTASTNASNAVTTANSAVTTANAATATANTASTNASTAVTTANNAVTTANTASTNASAAVTTANTAATDASNAVSTANTASTNASAALTAANNAVSTANTASTTANNAVVQAGVATSTANAAAAAVASAILYTIVANVAAIPATPANNTAVEVTDSTGIQSFTPLSGIPAGFVGSSGLSVRIVYQTAGSTWNWIQYFPNDPETRYLKFSGGTLTGQLLGDDSTSASTPGFAFDGDANTGMGRPGADELALITGGTARLTIDSAGNVSIPGNVGTLTSTGAVTGTALIPSSSTVPTNGVYLPAANTVGISTGGSGRLFVGSAGDVGIGGSPSGSYKLEVKAGAIDSAALFDSTNAVGPHIRFSTSGTDRHYLGSAPGFTAGGTSSDFAIRTAGYLALLTGGNNERLRITSTGLVGVGTSTPGYPLTVNGRISYAGAIGEGADTTLSSSSTTLIVGESATWQNLALRTNGSTRLYINSSGSVGIGTSSPGYKLDVVGESNLNGLRIGLNGDTINSTTAGASSVIAFQINGNEKIRLDSSGRLGIGTTSPQHILHLSSSSSSNYLRIDGSASRSYFGYETKGTVIYAQDQNGNASPLSFNIGGNEAGRFDTSSRLLLGTSSSVYSSSLLTVKGGVSTSVGDFNLASTVANITSGNDIGAIRITNTNGYRGAQIIATADGNWTEGSSQPTLLAFSTTASGGVNPTERMRIDSSGYLSGYTNGLGAGRIPAMQFYRLNSALVGANSTADQSVLGAGVTLVSSTVYAFEGLFIFTKSATGTTSHTVSLGFGGTATINNIFHMASSTALSNATGVGYDGTPTGYMANTAAYTVASGSASGAQSRAFIIRGSVSINAGGTFIPQYKLSAAPGSAYSTVAGSYFRIWPLGASGANTSIGTWA